MADEQEEEAPKPGMMDGAMLNQVITMYLYGCYMFKKGRLSPPEAMEKVMKLAQVMEKAGTAGQKIKEKLSAYSKKHG
ncbi:MAG: hypothetical protein HOE48_01005 [Candidatus Latescibacteria bacterium]|jgi:hypothetical protein|nr:hypothetical protein [Candidatus Latescibacterota bacterium]MBT4136454.1 hypothetical protein [Candidatus Latescibacterota bacterium]